MTLRRSTADWVVLRGVVVEGHRIASGAAPDSPYPRGSIEMQIPFFQKLGLDLTGYFRGTLNVSVAPLSVSLDHPRHVFRAVRWSPAHEPEDFSLSPCRVAHSGEWREGYVYQPHVDTKLGHFQQAGVIEVITSYLADVRYGDTLDVQVDGHEITVRSRVGETDG